MNRGVKIGCGILGLLGLAWLLVHTAPLAAARSNSAGGPIRAHTWTLSPASFHPVEIGYRSAVHRAPFPFTAAGVHFEPSGSAGLFLTAELRLRADGGEWSPWYGIEALEPQKDGRLYGENLVAWPRAREVQVRIDAPGPLSEALQDLILVAIDADGGPTTTQAAYAAQRRALSAAPASRATFGVPQPITIRRAEWGANESWMTWPPEYAPVDKMMIHHTVSGGGSDPAAEVRSIYYYHAVTRGWGDVGYNFLVDRYGNLYEGRYGGPDVIGGHVAYWNTGSLGVSVLGCYDYGACSQPMVPSVASLEALADLAAWTASRRGIDPRALKTFYSSYSSVTAYVLAGHRDYSATTCPGGNLYAELPALRTAAWERLPEYDARFGWQDTPASLKAGEGVTVYPNLYNYGRLVWSDVDGVRLGYRWLKDGQVVAENDAAAHIIPGAVVNFGEMTALVAQLTAPAVAGSYTLRWDMYRDGVGWFAEQPAPSGRGQPLELSVEVLPVLALDVALRPPYADAGRPISVNVTLGGPPGEPFESRTSWRAPAEYVVGSGVGDPGSLQFEAHGMTWNGAFDATPALASFVLTVSARLTAPLALPVTTTLDVSGALPLTLTRWFILNGYQSYLPLTVRGWRD